MLDIEIEELINQSIFLLLANEQYQLFFSLPKNELTAYLEKNQWKSFTEIDPLSCVLLNIQPELYKGGDDNFGISTLALLFDRRVDWIRSFIDGWIGQNNQHTSISGFLLGYKFRKLYKK